MRILIVGAGVVGFRLAHELAVGKHDITVVDPAPETIRAVAQKLDVMAVEGDGTSLDILRKAGIETAEMVVAVTASDEINLVVCLLAANFNVQKKIARIRKEDWFESGMLSQSDLAIDKIINTDRLIVNYVRKIIETPGLIDVAEFADPGLSLMGFRVLPDSPILGKKISDLRKGFSFDDFIIATIYRDQKMIIPSGEDIIREEDKCYILTNQEIVSFVLPIFNKGIDPIRSAVIYGGNRLGRLLAREIEDQIPNLVLVEPDKELAESASEALTKARVIHGDPMESEVLNELDLASVQVFISAGSDSKANLLTGLLAKKRGVGKAVIITDETEYLPVIDAVGLNVVIHPRLMIASEILGHIRAGRIHSVIKLKTGGVEMMEIEISPASKAVKKPLAKLNFPKGALIGAALEDGDPFFPNGSTELKPGQKVILIARSEIMEKAGSFFL